MARYKCPSCGAAYNGKRCRSCLYENFTEEIAHGNHTHEGEPLVISTPVRKPVKRKDPFGCDKRTRKKHPLAGFLVLLMLLGNLLPLIRNWGLELETMEKTHMEMEPAPYVPEDAMHLAANGDISIFADWRKGQNYVDGFDIYVLNDRDEDIAVTARDIVVNGCLLENTYFYCSAYEGEGSAGRSTLAISEEDLLYSGIQNIGTISFRLEAYSLDSYETFFVSDTITLTTPAAGDKNLYVAPKGLDIYQENGVLVRFVGFVPFRHEPEALQYGEFQFYIENETDEVMDVFASDVQLNGEPVELSFWTRLPPHTRTVTSMYLYALEDMDFESLEDIRELSFTLETAWQGEAKGGTHAERITIPLT